MKLFCLSAGILGVSAHLHSLSHLNFEEWKEHHGITFEPKEDASRLKHFLKAKEFVIEHNQKYMEGHESFHVALNEFAAMPNDEFLEKYTMPSWEAGTYGGVEDEEDIDGTSMWSCSQKYTSTSHSSSWNGANYATSVKNQNSCGSCWSFAGAAAMENAFCQHGKRCSSWHGLSTQQLIDCTNNNSALKPYDSQGCNGGFSANAIYYVFHSSKGIQSWDSYGYKGKVGSCSYKSSKSEGKVSGCGRLGTKGSQNNMCSMISHHGPSAVAIDASGASFQLYSGGIYTGGGCSSSRLNHAVTATGFTSNSLDVKNSWGSSWGDKGYVHFAKDGKTNTCGVYSEGQYAIW